MSLNALPHPASATTGPVSEAQRHAPYAEALERLTHFDWQQLQVPGHQADARGASTLAAFIGEHTLKLDMPMMFGQIDQDSWRFINPHKPSPLEEAQSLAAEAWGARRVWFLTNGASSGNHVGTMVARALGKKVIVQRSVHSSVIDGIAHAGIDAVFIRGAVDVDLGSSHGVTVETVQAALREHPDASCVYIVTPSYFGAVSDVAAIAEVVHAAGKPLIVDEAWGSHFGFHEGLPVNAARLGADLVISSTHKAAGSLTQSAMLMLGNGPHAIELEDTVNRVFRSYQSTSCSSLLLASLDEARRNLMVNGRESIARNLASVAAIRAGITERGRFRDATDDIRASEGTIDVDLFKVVIDVRPGKISGGEAAYRLLRDHRIVVELSTPSVIVLLVGATSPVDAERFLDALHALPEAPETLGRTVAVPAVSRREMAVQDAFFAPSELVPAAEAAGRISADALAAYPPGIPNLLPGEVVTEEIVHFLQATAADPSGYVRGAADPLVQTVRVLT
ncbi:MAG TPA: aminotransferase class V-fold PLP-dependent enzyme [Microbacteriaceae bacterium]|nr:aminotransferase class V-fold PLP-dependent enzyme [Microbacteriaceae bacterium]